MTPSQLVGMDASDVVTMSLYTAFTLNHLKIVIHKDTSSELKQIKRQHLVKQEREW